MSFMGGGSAVYSRPIWGTTSGKTGRWRVYGQSRLFMKHFGGHQWTEIRKIISDAFMDKGSDPIILQTIKNKIMHKVPVRSGFLLDYIMRTMRIKRNRYHNTHHILKFDWSYPFQRRPYPIPGRVQHSPPEQGYGEWRNVHLTHHIPNVHLDHVTPEGNALYTLDDPSSYSNFAGDINHDGAKAMADDFARKFNVIYFQVKVPWKFKTPMSDLSTVKY